MANMVMGVMVMGVMAMADTIDTDIMANMADRKKNRQKDQEPV